MANGGASFVSAPAPGIEPGEAGSPTLHHLPPGRGRRRILRRPRRDRLPGSRAVVGGLLVAAALVGLYVVASGRGSTADGYVVARRALPAGSELKASDLREARLDLPGAQRARAFTTPDALLGAVTVAPLASGELVQASAVVGAGTSRSSHEVSFSVERASLGPTLAAGDLVDVISTYGTGGDAYTTTVLRGARVLALDRGRSGLSEGPSTMTVGVDSETDALALAHAGALGKISVVRAGTAASGDRTAGAPLTYRPDSGADGRG